MTGKRVDFQQARDAIDGHCYRLLQATALLEVFARDNGRRATDNNELARWAATADFPRGDGGTIDPFQVLTDEQVQLCLKNARP